MICDYCSIKIKNWKDYTLTYNILSIGTLNKVWKENLYLAYIYKELYKLTFACYNCHVNILYSNTFLTRIFLWKYYLENNTYIHTDLKTSTECRKWLDGRFVLYLGIISSDHSLSKIEPRSLRYNTSIIPLDQRASVRKRKLSI